MPRTKAAVPAPAAADEVLHFGAHHLNIRRQQLWRGAQRVALQPKTWALLLVLVHRPGELVSIDTLLNALWPGAEVTHKALTNRIVELRKALGDDPQAPQLIQTVHRRGYRWLAEVQHGDGPAAAAAAPATVATAPASAGPGLHVGPPSGLAGRSAERAALAQHWAAAGQGARQLVLLTGEAGMGKTALVEAFARAVQAQPAAGAAALAGAGNGRMLREGCAFFEALARQRPLLLLLDDLHWADPATIDLLDQLDQLAQGRQPARMMVLATLQPALAQQAPLALAARLRRLAVPGQLRDLALGPLTLPEVQAHLAQRWCDAKLLAVLAETRQAHGDPAGARAALAQAEALLDGMPVHADEVGLARQRLALA